MFQIVNDSFIIAAGLIKIHLFTPGGTVVDRGKKIRKSGKFFTEQSGVAGVDGFKDDPVKGVPVQYSTTSRQLRESLRPKTLAT